MFYCLAASLNFIFKWLSVVRQCPMFGPTLFARLATERFVWPWNMALAENVWSFSRGFKIYRADCWAIIA